MRQCEKEEEGGGKKETKNRAKTCVILSHFLEPLNTDICITMWVLVLPVADTYSLQKNCRIMYNMIHVFKRTVVMFKKRETLFAST